MKRARSTVGFESGGWWLSPSQVMKFSVVYYAIHARNDVCTQAVVFNTVKIPYCPKKGPYGALRGPIEAKI
jgi:hypothetical protein